MISPAEQTTSSSLAVHSKMSVSLKKAFKAPAILIFLALWMVHGGDGGSIGKLRSTCTRLQRFKSQQVSAHNRIDSPSRFFLESRHIQTINHF